MAGKPSIMMMVIKKISIFSTKCGVIQLFSFSIVSTFQPFHLKFQPFFGQFYNLLVINHSCSIKLNFTLNKSYFLYIKKKNWSLKHVKCVRLDEIPAYSNVISSHTIYKIKIVGNYSLKLKARIAPHVNE